MSIFDMHQLVIDEYRKYVQSFLSIADEQIRKFIEETLLGQSTLWPDALLQLNPSYEIAPTAEELARQGKLHPISAEIFRSDSAQSIHLYRHQQIALAQLPHPNQ
jgi:ATP-dependent helicase YprA (DUF1998 family)